MNQLLNPERRHSMPVSLGAHSPRSLNPLGFRLILHKTRTLSWFAILSFSVVIASSPSVAEAHFWPRATRWGEAA
ncbi:MAG TPA: hypothetical protein VKB53_09920, partial [Gammaproteobacteria bacterium]|nr:hypothetical protein [Gammaproteobacteria bacterium]